MQNITFTPPNPEQRPPFWKSTDLSSTVESVKKNAARSPVFPVPAAGRWNKKGASLHVAILDVIAVPGFFRMYFGGFVIRRQ